VRKREEMELEKHLEEEEMLKAQEMEFQRQQEENDYM